MITYTHACAVSGSQEFVVPSAVVSELFSFAFTFILSAGESRLRVPFDITDDEVGLEALETYIGDISLSPQAVAAGYTLGTLTQATLQVVDDDGICMNYIVYSYS